ncbi:MAG: hypothetical protein WAX81_03820 [Candidatus Moraniibacteriota bacterium]
MTHELKETNEEYTICTCGRCFYQEYMTTDKWHRFLDHKKRAKYEDAAKERLSKRDRSELLKKWSGRLGHISGTTGRQSNGIPIWERKIDNYFVLCYFLERIFGGGVPDGELFAVIEEMPDGSLKPIEIGIQIDIVSTGVIRKIEIKEKKLIISYEKEAWRRVEAGRRVIDLTENHRVLRF